MAPRKACEMLPERKTKADGSFEQSAPIANEIEPGIVLRFAQQSGRSNRRPFGDNCTDLIDDVGLGQAGTAREDLDSVAIKIARVEIHQRESAGASKRYIDGAD